MSEIHKHTFDNGLHLLAQQVQGAKSLAISILMPAGVSMESEDNQGSASLLEELICRGAGELKSREHSDALDQLGVQRGTDAGISYFRVGATLIGSKVEESLPLITDMVRKPRFDDECFAPSQDLCLQALEALEDDHSHMTSILLREKHYPSPYNRNAMGSAEYIKRGTIDDVKRFWQRTFVPNGATIAFAGDFDWASIKDQTEGLLGDWTGKAEHPSDEGNGVMGYSHHEAKTQQVQIGLAYNAIPEIHPDSMLQQAALAILSGGMSCRLFTEVREKRGLCYSVGARYGANKTRGTVLAYAGTTTQRAQETLDVLISELRRMADGVTESEFKRAIVGMKTRIVMSGQSTGSRAGAISADQLVYGYPRTLESLVEKVSQINFDELNAFIKKNPPGDMTVVTTGPEALKVNG